MLSQEASPRMGVPNQVVEQIAEQLVKSAVELMAHGA
jgi:hypothetical protein